MNRKVKRLAVWLMIAFFYLATGFQFAHFNWDLYSGKYPDTNTVRFVKHMLWPVSSIWSSEEPLIRSLYRYPKHKNAYIGMMTVGWIAKIAYCIVVNIVVVAITIIIMFGFVFISFLNAILSPFRFTIPYVG